MYCKIVIPSHKRADRVKTLEIVNNAIVCVSENQKDEYKHYNPDAEIVTHPNDLIGLIPKRNWMVKHFGDIFMMDDDLTYFRKLYIELGESPIIKDKSVTTQKIYELYDLAKLIGVNVFGFTNKNNPLQFEQFKYLSLSNSITGCAYGMIKNDHLKWDESFQLKEDYFISCLAKYHDRKILTDIRYNFTQEKTFKNSGGLSEIRNHETELYNMVRLKKYFGDTVNIKTGTSTNQLVKKNDVNVKFKF
jgi:hypothetical protein